MERRSIPENMGRISIIRSTGDSSAIEGIATMIGRSASIVGDTKPIRHSESEIPGYRNGNDEK